MVFQVPEEELEACPLPEWVFLLVTVEEDFAVWETDVRAAAWGGEEYLSGAYRTGKGMLQEF